MLTIKLDGGLGNQMFQYAFIKSIADSRSQPFELDISGYAKNKKRGTFGLEHFNIPKVFTSNSLLTRDLFFLRMLRKLGISKFGKTYIEINSCYDDSALKCSCDYFYGYFQSFKYFNHLRSSLIQDFDFLKGQQSKYFPSITESESVGVHVRRGDYVSNKKVFNLMFQLDKNYYITASNKIAEVIKKPLNFFLFTNDPSWVKENLLPKLVEIGQCTLVHHEYTKEGSLYDFECLKKCKHQIIANSSFSWWAAYLNEYEKRKVVAPPKWYRTRYWDWNEFYPKDWIKEISV